MKERHFETIWFIPGHNRGAYPQCHSIYIADGGGVVIDPSSDRKRLLELRQEPGVEAVWLSHYHEDHFMFQDLFDDLPLWMSGHDAPPMTDLEFFIDSYGIRDPGFRRFWKTYLEKDFRFKPRKPARCFHGHEVITLGGTTIEVIPAPGHTLGHTAFFFREPGVLFLGDYCFSWLGPWYGSLQSSIEDTISSIRYLRTLPARVWLTSHETGIFEENPGHLWDAYLGHIERREQAFLDLLKTPRTMEEIVSAWIIYKQPREPIAIWETSERSLARKHIEKLIRDGLVVRDGDWYRRV